MYAATTPAFAGDCDTGSRRNTTLPAGDIHGASESPRHERGPPSRNLTPIPGRVGPARPAGEPILAGAGVEIGAIEGDRDLRASRGKAGVFPPRVLGSSRRLGRPAGRPYTRSSRFQRGLKSPLCRDVSSGGFGQPRRRFHGMKVFLGDAISEVSHQGWPGGFCQADKLGQKLLVATYAAQSQAHIEYFDILFRCLYHFLLNSFFERLMY